MGHWARDCRYETNTTKPSTGASTSTAPKASVSTITCRYCRKPGHTKEEYRKLKYVNAKRAGEPTNSSTQNSKNSSLQPQNNRNLIRRNILNNTARQKIEQDHVQCQSPQTIPTDSKFLIDS
ncbi:CCHC-type domain-containing protein, partial [Aphis craccivora]